VTDTGLEGNTQNAPPHGPGSDHFAMRVDLVPVELTATGVDINLVSAEPTSTLPDEATDPEEDDDGDSKHELEEALSSVESTSGGSDGNEELQGISIRRIWVGLVG
jgi:hypothetical protein